MPDSTRVRTRWWLTLRARTTAGSGISRAETTLTARRSRSRKYAGGGGVLEHPRGSVLWERCGMALPGQLPDAHGGISLDVNQVDWGHVARKATWLYLVGVRPEAYPRMPRLEPTHWISGGRGRTATRNHTPVPPGIKVCSAQQRRRTPPAFAEFLVSLARAVSP